MKMTVIGGGNIGTLIAAEMAYKGNEVTVYTSKPGQWSKEPEVLDAKGQFLFKGSLRHVTDSMEEALQSAELIWITVPAQMFTNIEKKMFPHVKKGQYIGVVPGSGGAEFAFSKLINKGCVLFGLQRVPFIARLKEYGASVYMLGRKSQLQLGSIPATQAPELSGMAQEWFDMECVSLPNYLSVTLTPSNPILHTARIYTMFQDYEEGRVYSRNFLFYEEWDDTDSKMLIACDKELQQLCRTIPLDLAAVKSLCVHYDSFDAVAMTKKLRSIPAFLGLNSPMKQSGGGWVLDFSSRYFTSDFSYGLKIIKDLAKLYEQPAPNINRIWDWYKQIAPMEEEQVFELRMEKKELMGLY